MTRLPHLGAGRRLALVLAAALCLSTTACLAAASPAAAAIGKEEALFRLGLSSGTKAIAADPTTGQTYLYDPGNHRIDEFSPWGQLVKGIGWDATPGAVNEQQEVRVRASAGAFKLSFEGKQTADLPFDASAAQVEGALNALESIEGPGGEVSVTEQIGSPGGEVPYLYVVAFKGSLAGTDVPQLTIEDGAAALEGGAPSTIEEVRTRAEGTADGTGLEDCTPESGCKAGSAGEGAGQIGFGPEAVEGLAVGPEGDLYVGEGEPNDRVQVFSPSGRFLRMFGGDVIRDGAAGEGILTSGSSEVKAVITTAKAFRVGQPIEGTGIEAGTTIAALASGKITLSQPAGPAATGTPTVLSVPPGPNNVAANEVQTVALGAGVNGGSFTLTFKTPNPSPSEAKTEAIPWNAGAAELEAKLNALANMKAVGGEVKVSGPAGGPWEVEFGGTRYAGSDVMRLKSETGKLSGGQAAVAVSSESGYEVCEAAAECQAGAVEGARVQHGGLEPVDADGPLALGADALYVADGLRIERFDPATGAYLGDLPDPGPVRSSAPFFGLGIAHLAIEPGSSGPLYFDFPAESNNGFGSEHVYALDPASGALLGTLTLNPGANGKPGALAVDPAGTLYAVDAQNAARDAHVIAFDEGGHQLAPDPAEEEQCEDQEGTDPRGFCEEALGIQAGSGVNFGGSFVALGTGPAGDLYVGGRAASGEEFLQAYGPPPLAYESPPPAPPAIEDQFAASVYAGGAEVRAKINPRFFSGDLGTTRYYVQYAIAACLEPVPGEPNWKAPCVKEEPAPPGALLKGGAVNKGVGVAVALEGLAAASTYRYRFVAEGSGASGEAVYGLGGEPGTEGKDASFATPRPPGAPEACPANEAFRTAPALPDCRAYEMVSPLDKGGGDIAALAGISTNLPATLDQSAVSGDRFAYGTYKSFGEAQSAPFTSEYVAARGPGGWQSHAVSPPRTTPLGNALRMFTAEIQLFSPDLCEAWARTLAEPPLAPEAVPGYFNLYRRSDGECGGPDYEALSTVKPQVPRDLFQLELQGLAAGGNKAFYAAAGQLTPDAPPLALGSGTQSPVQLYERSGEQLRFLCILPDGQASPKRCSAGWAKMQGEGLGYNASLQGAVSADGERVFWTEGAENGPIYLRIHPDREPSAFALGPPGKGTLSEGSTTVAALEVAEATASFPASSEQIELGPVKFGEFLPGATIAASGFPAGTKVTACSPDCTAPTALSVDHPSTAAKANVKIVSRGPMPFAAGQAITGDGISFGTKIEAAEASKLVLSKPVGHLGESTKSGVELNATGPCSEPELACTIPVSEPAEAERAGEGKKVAGSHYYAAAADGSRAIFATGGALYEARIEADPEGHLVAEDTQIAAGFAGFLGASEDVSRVYFASSEDLSPNPEHPLENPLGDSPVPGKPNLYLYDANKPAEERLFFIGTLSGEDAFLSVRGFNQTTPLSDLPGGHSARVSSDGLHAAFNSSAPLTGYDNTDRGSGKADTEVFLYDAAANGGEGELLCASCNPTGQRPLGEAIKETWVSGRIPGAWNDLYASRPLSANGHRLFFDSSDALVPADSNGAEDVYEWEAPGEGGCTASSSSFAPTNGGCLYLISSGKSAAGSEFLDADPEGKNVFFTTLASLLPQDPGLTDVYDARQGGGLPPPASPPSPCQGEACQSSPAPPEAPTPASSAFEGAGNLSEGQATSGRCAKGKARRHGRCAAKPHKRHRRHAGRAAR